MSKPAKGARRTSSTVGKKKDNKGLSSPDGSSRNDTPTTSVDSMGHEKEFSIDSILDNEEVANLLLRKSDLIKLHPPKPTTDISIQLENVRKVMVHQEPENSKPKDKDKLQRVGVLQPLPPDTLVTASKVLGTSPAGPRFDGDGTFVSHSILGKVKDFSNELKNRNMVESASPFTRPPPIIQSKVVNPKPPPKMSYRKTILPREKHALQNWDKTMEERRYQQQYLADKLLCSPEELVMNKGDGHRKRVEKRSRVIDQGRPKKPKGYAEFWKQEGRLGDDETGMNVTLTQTEKGFPPEVEHIAVPSYVTNVEKGLSKQGQSIPMEFTYHKSCHLSEDQKSLPPSKEYIPEISELSVIGNLPEPKPCDSANSSIPASSTRFRLKTDSLDSLGEEGDTEDSSNAAMDAECLDARLRSNSSEIESKKMQGPILKLDNTVLKWTGVASALMHRYSSFQLMEIASKSDILCPPPRLAVTKEKLSGSMVELQSPGETVCLQAIEFRVNMEGQAGSIATSSLNMENLGSTAIYFSWKSLPRVNSLGTVQGRDCQRFYFDTRGGVLRPGQKLAFPFLFKSSNPGIFSEKWMLTTRPLCNQGRPLIVTLKGVCSQEDLYARRRNQIEQMLAHREAEAAANELMDQIMRSVKTPPRSPPQRKTIVMEEDIFKEKNPDMYYHYNVVQQLKRLHIITVCPELVQDLESLPSGSKGERSAGKKSEEKSSTSKKSAAEEKSGGKKSAPIKEKKLVKKKTEYLKDEVLEPIPASPVEAPKWDLSISTLLEIIMNVEDETSREEKLKQLNHYVGLLSFPPAPSIKRNPYHLCYLALCDAMDRVAETSAHLCEVMGLPVKEFSGVKGNEDDAVSNMLHSPAHKSKNEKKGTPVKEKKGDLKKPVNKDKERSPSTSSKQKKSKRLGDSGHHGDLHEDKRPGSAIAIEPVDPILEEKYKENFHAAVQLILGSAVEKMVLLMEN